MSDIAVFLAGAALAYGATRWLDVPTTPLLLLAGFLLAETELIPRDLLQDALVLGLTFVLFIVGIELTPRRVRTQRKPALRVGLWQFGTIAVLGSLAALGLGLDPLTALYLGLALTASSTLVVVRLLQTRRQLFEPYGRLVLGVLLLQDVLIILLVPVLVQLPVGWPAVMESVLGTTALVVLAFLGQRVVAPSIVRLGHDEEMLLLTALAVLFGFVGIAYWLALPVAVGAFLAGVALAPFPVSGLLRGPLSSVVTFFTAAFFLALGGLLSLPSPRILLNALGLTLVLIVATPVVVTVVAERAGFAARPALEAGLLLSQTSELSLVIGLYALLLGQISAATFNTLALVTVFTMVLTPFLAGDAVVERLLRLHPVPGRRADDLPLPRDHTVLLGSGSGGMPLLETLVASGASVAVVDHDPEIVDRLRQGGIACVHGDVSSPRTLREAGVERAGVVISMIRRPRENEHLLRAARNGVALVRVFDDEDARWVEERGGVPVLTSDAAAEEFTRWFDSRFAGRDAQGS